MKTKIKKRSLFKEGDVIIDSNNVELIYIKAYGFDKALVSLPGSKNSFVSKNPHYFHPDFDPGYIAENFN